MIHDDSMSQLEFYPLVNVYKKDYGKNHHFIGKPDELSMAIFNRYVKLPVGISINIPVLSHDHPY